MIENRRYVRLGIEDREEISRGLARGDSFRVIAGLLGRSTSTISREVYQVGNTRSTYRAGRSQWRSRRKAQGRRQGKRKIMLHGLLREHVESQLRLRWSPEQIAQWLKMQYPNDMSMQVSHESIYAYVYILPRGELKKELLATLRQNRKRRHKRGRIVAKPRPLEDMVSIDDRPPEIDQRRIPGHWEGDILVGRNRQSAMGSLVERYTRFTILVPLKSKHASEVSRSFARELNKLPAHTRLSMTYDQGRGMAQHKLLSKAANIKVYFAHKGCPWERGTNENTNGLVRQFFPKGTDFRLIPRKEINKVQDLLNGRPRKILGWHSPYEAFSQSVALKT